jgi:hypothetical protein
VAGKIYIVGGPAGIMHVACTTYFLIVIIVHGIRLNRAGVPGITSKDSIIKD